MQSLLEEVEQLENSIPEEEHPFIEFKPDFLFDSVVYQTRRRFVSKNFDEYIYFKKPQHVFDESAYLHFLLKKKQYLGMEKTKANASKIYKYLVGMITYENDRVDNWRPVTETLLAGKGDCDDSAVVLVSAFGMAGWTNDEVFLSVGNFVQDNGEKFYHAWCNVKIGGKWYIAEGTDQFASLKLWSTHRKTYLVDEVWNWKWAGLLTSREKYFDKE